MGDVRCPDDRKWGTFFALADMHSFEVMRTTDCAAALVTGIEVFTWLEGGDELGIGLCRNSHHFR